VILTMVNWIERLLTGTMLPADPLRNGQAQHRPRPLKIAVERLPDYLWRELGFQPTRRPEDDPWHRVQ